MKGQSNNAKSVLKDKTKELKQKISNDQEKLKSVVEYERRSPKIVKPKKISRRYNTKKVTVNVRVPKTD